MFKLSEMFQKSIFTIFCITLFSIPSWASNDFPVEQFNIDPPPPPPTAPIDNYLPFAILIMILMVAHYFNNRAKLLKNKN